MDKKRSIKTTYIIVIVFSIIFVTISTISAWYVSMFGVNGDTNLASSNAAYFASGDGSSTHPYEINQPRHLYNLAWLQDLGYFDDADPKTDGIQPYHFVLSKNIDMRELRKGDVVTALPPIGTTDHPFVSRFDGDSHTINNLLIDTDFDKSKGYIQPSDSVILQHTTTTKKVVETITGDTITNYTIHTNRVGMFGIVQKNALTNENTTDIKNLFLDGTRVITTIPNSRTGIVAGYLNTTAAAIGVHNSAIVPKISGLSSSTIISQYTLIGEYDREIADVEWEQGTGDLGYGTSTNMGKLYDLAKASIPNGDQKQNQMLFGGTYAFPFQTSSQTSYTAAGSYSMRINNNPKSVTYATTFPATNHNIGYYVGGSGNSGAGKSTSVNKNASTSWPSTYYKPPTNANDNPNTATVPSEVADYMTKTYDATTKNYNYFMQLINSNQTQASALTNESGLLAIPDGQVGDYHGVVVVPRSCIWIAPIQEGTFKFIVGGAANQQLVIHKWKRRVPQDYSTDFTTHSRLVTYGLSTNNANTDKLYYVEIEITKEDILGGYEYTFTGGDNNGVNVYYMDIGTEGGKSSEDFVGKITGIDFVARNASGGFDAPYFDAANPAASNVSKVLFSITSSTGYSSTNTSVEFNRVLSPSDMVEYYYIPSNSLTIEKIGQGQASSVASSPFD